MPPRPPTPPPMPQLFSNEQQAPWERFYDHHTSHQYIDRHHLYNVVPELFPPPPHVTKNDNWRETLDTEVFACHCGADVAISDMTTIVGDDEVTTISCPACGNKVRYASQFVVGRTTDAVRGAARCVEVPLAPPLPPPERVYVGDFGCGAGALAYPLCEKNAAAFVTGFDFASSAVISARCRPRYDPSRMRFIQHDLTAPVDVAEVLAQSTLPPGRLFDYGIMVFVLSALEPAQRVPALRGVAELLAPNASFTIYDYCAGDFRQRKFNEKSEPVFGRSDTFIRGAEETIAAFYSPDELCAVAREAGFRVAEVKVKTQEVLNRAEGVSLDRKFVLLKLRKENNE